MEKQKQLYSFRRCKAVGRAASSASRACQQEWSSGATGGRRCHLARSTAVTQAAAPVQAPSLGCLSVCLGVAWSPRPDTCAQRDGCSVKWLASHPRGLHRYWPGRDSWGVTRPISDRCVSRRGYVFLRGFRHFSYGGSAHVEHSPFCKAPVRAEAVCFPIRAYKHK